MTKAHVHLAEGSYGRPRRTTTCGEATPGISDVERDSEKRRIGLRRARCSCKAHSVVSDTNRTISRVNASRAHPKLVAAPVLSASRRSCRVALISTKHDRIEARLYTSFDSRFQKPTCRDPQWQAQQGRRQSKQTCMRSEVSRVSMPETDDGTYLRIVDFVEPPKMARRQRDCTRADSLSA